MTTSDIFSNQRDVWRNYKDLYTLAGRALPFIAGIVIGGIIFASDEGYFTNLYTEILSIIATVGVLDYLNKRDRQNEAIQNVKERLIRDAGSSINAIAIKAVEDLRTQGWLAGNDGLLRRVDLVSANLESASLSTANLAGATILNANLRKAVLTYSNLEQADLSSGDLTGANLSSANLTATKLWNAKLTGANLEGSNLMVAELWNTNLEGVNLLMATLPDGTRWTENVDMGRFTDINHPEFNITRAKIDILRGKMGIE
jgi:hypothetical protein